MFQRILVAIDDPETSWSAFEEALNLAKQLDAQVMLFHALSPETENHQMIPTFTPDYYPLVSEELIRQYCEERATAERHGVAMLRSLTIEAAAVGVRADFSQEMGDPGRLICATATHWQADLIVMGRRGRKGLSEFLLGSVSNYVLHHASCSVLTVQGKLTAPSSESATTETIASSL